MCEVCGGDLQWMYMLGTMDHFKCRGCGMNHTASHECVFEEAEHVDLSGPRGFGTLYYDRSHDCGVCRCGAMECET